MSIKLVDSLRKRNQMIEITNWQLKVCIRALRVMADQEKNDSTFGSVLLDFEEKLSIINSEETEQQ
jgi:hypothetical protein